MVVYSYYIKQRRASRVRSHAKGNQLVNYCWGERTRCRKAVWWCDHDAAVVCSVSSISYQACRYSVRTQNLSTKKSTNLNLDWKMKSTWYQVLVLYAGKIENDIHAYLNSYLSFKYFQFCGGSASCWPRASCVITVITAAATATTSCTTTNSSRATATPRKRRLCVQARPHLHGHSILEKNRGMISIR